MLKVRFPNGQCITYNEANCLIYRDHGNDLYESEKQKKWIATVPHDCIVESVDPCKIENPMIELTLDKAFEMVIKSIENRETNRGLAQLKRLLKNYNISKCEWTD